VEDRIAQAKAMFFNLTNDKRAQVANQLSDQPDFPST